MVAQIREDTKQTILERTDIVDLVGEYLRLQKSGSRFKALCPFHKEKTPSFVVSPERQMFHCFGCGAGGDAIKFVQLQEKLDFVGALEFLGRRVGVHLEWSMKENSGTSTLDNRLLQEAMEFYHQQLKKEQSTRIRSLLQKRGLSSEIVNLFQVGYADRQWDSMLEYFKRKKVNPETLANVGLASQNSGGNQAYRDWFRDRLIFPILSISGQVVGFGGRALDDTPPKYLNSPEKGKFKKGQLLYALNLARKAMMEKRVALLAEGYMDVVALHRFGFTHSVGSLGTALTPDQVRLLKRYVDCCYLVYDGDEAGQKAALRGLDLFRDVDLPCRVVTLPPGTDPDDFLAQQGPEAFQTLIDQALEAFDYRLEAIASKYDLQTLEGRRSVIRNLGEWTFGVSSPVARASYWERLADRMKVSLNVMMDEVESIHRSKRRTKVRSSEESDSSPVSLMKQPTQEQLAKKGLLALVFESPNFMEPLEKFWNSFEKEPLDAYDLLLKQVIQWYRERGPLDMDLLRKHLEQENPGDLLAQILLGDPVPNNRQKAFDEYCQKIRYHQLQRQILKQVNQLKEVQGEIEPLDASKWTKEAYQLEQERYNLGVNR